MTTIKLNQQTKTELTVRIASHFLQLSNLSALAKQALRMYLGRTLIDKVLVKENGRWITERGKMYFYISPDKEVAHLHINLKNTLFQVLRSVGIIESKMDIQTLDLKDYTAFPSGYLIKETFILRDYQVPIYQACLDDQARKIISMPTGTGKTLTALKIAESYGKRFCVLMLPKYKDKWIEDVVSTSANVGTLDKRNKFNHYLVLDNITKLVDYLDGCRIDPGWDKDDIWCIILPITVLESYYKLYRKQLEDGYGDLIHPAEIWETMGIGLRITDEVHEHFHRNVMIDLQTHLPKTLYLSATLDPSGEFARKMYQMMFPESERMGRELYIPYINVYSCWYSHRIPEYWKHIRRGAYSHTFYESHYLKETKYALRCREQYFSLIYAQIERFYLNIRKPGQKAIIFFSMVETCTKFVEWLKAKLPDMDIRRYISEDDYEDIMTAEIAVSTPGSAGTAIDIKGLILNIMTLSLRSQQANLQIMGRTRVIKDYPDQKPTFVFLVARDIPKSVEYCHEKERLLKDRALSFNKIDTHLSIG